MKAKKMLAAVLSFAMVIGGSLAASAASVNFGGYSSGGLQGSTYLAGQIGTSSSGAYYAVAGFDTSDINAPFTLTMSSQLRITKSPQGSLTVNKSDQSYSFSGGYILGKNIEKFGIESNYPPNHYNNDSFIYSYATVDVAFSSSMYGSWSGSGRMNFT